MKRLDKIRLEHFLIAILLFQVIIDFILVGRIWNINTEILDTAYEWLSGYHKRIWNTILWLFLTFIIYKKTE